MTDELRERLARVALEIAQDNHNEVAGQDTSGRYPETTGREIADAILNEIKAAGYSLAKTDRLTRLHAAAWTAYTFLHNGLFEEPGPSQEAGGE